MKTWDLLICSIWHRTAQLRALLLALEWQVQPWVRVRVFRDNLETGYGAKCQALLESSSADYVSFIDDDDMVAPDFVSSILAALRLDPDYVGFEVKYTEDGVRQLPVVHSLEYGNWINAPNAHFRDIVHFNPIRRTLALKGQWRGGNGADRMWAHELREQGCVKTQVFIPREMYFYQHVMADTFNAPRAPLPDEPPRPEHPFVTYL